MQLQLIRNATLLLDYGGQHVLIDPDFGAKNARRSLTGKSPNPMVDLPLPPERILASVQAVVVSHLHADHFDPVAQSVIPKSLPLFCQPENEDFIREKGFEQVMPITDKAEWQAVQITRTGGHHGLGYVETQMGTVSGFVFQAEGEPTIYWAGDTVMCDEVRAAVATYQPDMMITHSCGAKWPDESGERQLIVMDAAQTIEVCRLAPTGTVIAVHMEALDHATVSRADLRAAADAAGISEARLRIPADGETIT
jgi:L-ascorbate metabolism protein UlaG (beta-lactamase superfamily)